MLRRRLLAVALPILLCALAGGLSACGSGGGDVHQVLSQTFGSQSSVRSGRLDLALEATVAGQASTGPTALRLSGPFQSAGGGRLPRFDFSLAVTSGGRTTTLGGVSTGDRGYLRLMGQTFALSPQLYTQLQQGYRQAQKRSSSGHKSASAFRALGIDPSRWLLNPREVGDAKIGDANTIHIASGIRVPQLLADLERLEARANALGTSSALTPQQRAQLQRDVQSAHLDLYTGKDDHLLRRLDLRVNFKQTAKSKGGLLHLVLNLDRVNEDQQISAPAHAQPLANLVGALKAAAGQAGAPTGSGSAGGQATTPAPSTGGSGASASPAPSAGTGQSAYLRCIQKAGQDIAAAQKCASLLGG